MKKLDGKSAIKLCLIGLGAAVLLYGGTAAAGDLSVCIDKSSPGKTMDYRLARAVAAQQGNTLEVHEFDGSSGGDEGFGIKEFSKLAHDSCALVLGFPIDPIEKDALSGLRATTPYGHTGFVLVTDAGSKATTLDQLPKLTTVAVTFQTTPNLYFANHPNLQADVHLTNEDALKALENHKVRAAMLWQPTVVNYLTQRHEAQRFAYHELHQPHAEFNVVALYDSDHAKTAAAFEQSIAAMTASGELAKVMNPYAETGPVQPLDHPVQHDRPAAAPLSQPVAEHSSSAKTRPAAGDLPPALFTRAQATAGQQKYYVDCALCHGALMEGRSGPGLKGKYFAPAKADFHVRDIFAIVSQNMPAYEPGSLSHDDYVEIMAYILQQNGYPAGDKALTFEEAKESKVKLIYHE